MNDLRIALRQVLQNIVCAFALALAFGNWAMAQDWPQWRGPARDGLVPAFNAPKSWPGSFRPVWRVDIGEGYSSPVVSGGRAFVHVRRDPDEIVIAVDLASGKTLWQQQYPASFQKNQAAPRMAKGPYSTPLIVSNTLITLGATAVVAAWETKDGRRLWTRDFSKIVETSKLFCGTAASPMALRDLIIIQVGSDLHGGLVLALDRATGSTQWEARGAGPGYASPIVIETSGTTQIVTLTERSIIGIDAKNGAELWSAPFPDEWQENIVTPLWTGSHLIVSGTRQGTHAYALQKTNGSWHASEAWKNTEVTMYMSSPVFGDGLIYGHSRKQRGQFVALEATTGALRWASEGREGDHACVLLTPSEIVFLTKDANLIAVRRGTATFEIARRYKVAEGETWAMPVLLGPNVLVRDSTSLILLNHGADNSQLP